MTVTVVDNASGDGTVGTVERDFPEVELVGSPENLGFSKANNLGIRRGSAPYVLALNPDTRGPGRRARPPLELMKEHPEIGSAPPSRAGRRILRPCREAFVSTPVSALGHFTGLGRRPGAAGRLADCLAPSVSEGPVDAVNGAFMLMRREGYWMCMEDFDLCYRFARAGRVTWYEPSVTVVHVKAESSGKLHQPRVNCHFHHGMLRFYR